MALASCFDATPYYARATGMTDVATIISDLRTALVTNSGWSEPSADLFKSPVFGTNKFLDVLFTRIAAGNLEMRVRDQNAVTICTRRAQIDVAGTAVQYYASPRGFILDSERATREQLGAGMLDLTPASEEAHSIYVYGHGHRNTSDTAGNNAASERFMLDNGVATTANRVLYLRNTVVAWSPTFGTTENAFTDAWVYANFSGTNRRAGRFFNTILVASATAFDTEFTLVIGDAGETGVFRTVGLATGDAVYRLAVRKS